MIETQTRHCGSSGNRSETMTHWVDYLPEVGRPTQKLGEEQMRISAEINALYKQIQALEKQHSDGKEKLLVHVRQFWTNEEITKAETQWGKEFQR
jgi:hypothetical protein